MERPAGWVSFLQRYKDLGFRVSPCLVINASKGVSEYSDARRGER